MSEQTIEYVVESQGADGVWRRFTEPLSADLAEEHLALVRRAGAESGQDPARFRLTPLPWDDSIFREAWAKKEADGYQYGRDALAQVRLGWDMALVHFSISSPCPASQQRYRLREYDLGRQPDMQRALSTIKRICNRDRTASPALNGIRIQKSGEGYFTVSVLSAHASREELADLLDFARLLDKAL